MSCDAVRVRGAHFSTLGPEPSGRQASWPTTRPLLKPCVLRLGLLVDGDVNICVFPEGEEVLIGGTSLGFVAFQKVGAREPQVGQPAQREIQYDPAVVDNLLELRRGFLPLVCQQVGLPAKINGIQRSKLKRAHSGPIRTEQQLLGFRWR